MGGQTILDLIASTLVFGSLLLMGLRINASNTDNMQAYRGDLLVQENLVSVITMLEYDFRKIGYCKDPSKIPDPNKAIIYASTNKLKFLTDLPVSSSNLIGDGIVDTLEYSVGDVSETPNTPNPRDRLLYRVENSSPRIGVNLGVTIFDLQYFDESKVKLTAPVAVPGNIRTIQITIQVENLAGYTYLKQFGGGQMDSILNTYQSAYWRQVRLVARNLDNR